MRRAIAMTLLIAGCASDGLPTTSGTVLEYPGLQQHIRLASNITYVGGTLDITSVVVNEGNKAYQVSARGCPGLEVRGIEFTQHDVVECQSIVTGYLLPGDSVSAHEVTAAVASVPGTYTVRVQQLLAPAGSVSIEVRVVPPDTVEHEASKIH